MSHLNLRAVLKIWVHEEKRPKTEAVSTDERTLPLSVCFRNEMRRTQNANLISHIYVRSGNGTLPVSGGKVELKNPGKVFKES